MREEAITLGVLGMYVTLVLTITYGWIMNVINLISGDVYTNLSTIIIGAVGVLAAPLGALVHFVAG